MFQGPFTSRPLSRAPLLFMAVSYSMVWVGTWMVLLQAFVYKFLRGGRVFLLSGVSLV